MVKVAQRGRFSIYVYSELGQPHHLPHCHVSWPDGESVVDLALLSVLKGDPLPGAARELLREHLAQVKRLDVAQSGETDFMTATTVKTRPWERREYARIVSVRFHAPRLLVLFADGTEVSVEPERFANPTIRSQAPDWSRARAGGHEVVVPAASGEVGIPWDTIRALTDAEFAAHWANLAGGVAREIGIRLRGFRNERGLGIPELARLAGVPVTTVSRVEAGSHPIDLGLLDRLLAPLGRTSADLNDEPVASTG